jgi:hypothetical protein
MAVVFLLAVLTALVVASLYLMIASLPGGPGDPTNWGILLVFPLIALTRASLHVHPTDRPALVVFRGYVGIEGGEQRFSSAAAAPELARWSCRTDE